MRNFSKDGRLISIQDAGILRVALDYNAAGRLTTARPSGASSRAIQFSYTADGHISAMADASGRTVTFGYDGGNLVQQTNADGSNISYAYDGSGRLQAAGQTAIAYGSDAAFTGVASVTSRWARQYRCGAAGGDRCRRQYHLRSTVAGHPDDRRRWGHHVAYDATGHKTSTTNANGGIIRLVRRLRKSPRSPTRAESLDRQLQRRSASQLTDAGKNAWQFNYDAAGPHAGDRPYGVNTSLTGMPPGGYGSGGQQRNQKLSVRC